MVTGAQKQPGPITSVQEVRAIVDSADGPQFMLPERFEHVSFANYEIPQGVPGQEEVIEKLRGILENPATRQRFWQRLKQPETGQGLYIAGPPGVGKTHLLAATFIEADEPKLYATFDEFMAAAGTMGMRDLADYLAANRLVCIDEIDLDDPASIMLLTSLLGIMLDAGTRVIATANASPQLMSSEARNTAAFHRELGIIADAFDLIWLDGADWRMKLGAMDRSDCGDADDTQSLHLSWQALLELLRSTHPMYDAAWLKQTSAIVLNDMKPLADSDQAIRFVRFIDRVYDRNVGLYVRAEPPPFEAILEPIAGDGRHALHYARCRSRLVELLGYGDQTGLKSASGSVVS